MKTLHVYHTVSAGYYYKFSKHSPADGLNLQEHPENVLLDSFKEYDWVHFWSEAKLETMKKMFHQSDRPIISFTNLFGEPIFPHGEKPFDIQFHVSRQAMAKFFRKDRRGWTCENIISYLPIDTEVFAPRARLTTGDFIVGRTGRPDPWKWDLFTLKVVERLIQAGIPAKLLSVGGVPDFVRHYMTDHCIPSAVAAPYLTRTQETDSRVAKYLSLVDAYIHSSFIGESCGVSILEAMSMGLPVIVRDTPYADNAPAEYIEDGVNGFLVKNVKEGSEKAMKLVKDPEFRKAIGTKARKTIEEKFDSKKVVKRMEDAVSVVTRNGVIKNESKMQMQRLLFLLGVQARRRGMIR